MPLRHMQCGVTSAAMCNAATTNRAANPLGGVIADDVTFASVTVRSTNNAFTNRPTKRTKQYDAMPNLLARRWHRSATLCATVSSAPSLVSSRCYLTTQLSVSTLNCSHNEQVHFKTKTKQKYKPGNQLGTRNIRFYS
jgi:hypothetical protein